MGHGNFADWNGYQPPFTSIEPDRLIEEGVVPQTLAEAVVDRGGRSRRDYIQSELTPEADQLWLDAWNEIQAGG